MSDKVSVIVPVYNTKQYLEQCVKSIVTQTYQNLELLLIDDGSTDGSGALCDEIALRDERIRSLHQENQGLSGARNTGLSAAEGEWIVFADSDDFWGSQNLLERLIFQASETSCDVVCFNYRRVWEDGSVGNAEIACGEASTDIASLVRSNAYVSSACTKMVRRTLLEKEDIRFVPKVYSEDVLWSLKLLKAARQIACVPDVWYGYSVREGSITQRRPLKNVTDLFRAVCDCESVSLTCADDERKALCMDYTAFYYCMLLAYMHLASPKPDSAFVSAVYAKKYLLKGRSHRIVRLIRLCSAVTGVRVTSQLLKQYVQLTTKRKRKESKPYEG